MPKLDGKVAFITGAARGQGRSHAVRLAEDGADIIAVDVCAEIPTLGYPMATSEDLQETVRLVEKTGRRIVANTADVRDRAALKAGLDAGLDTFGRLDIVVANAGVIGVGSREEQDDEDAWLEVININLSGVWRTVRLTAPRLIEQGEGGSIVITSSTAGIKALGFAMSGDLDAYTASKHGVVGLMRTFAKNLAPHSIRVNTLHPTGVNTAMIGNEPVGGMLMGLAATQGDGVSNLMPVGVIEPEDVSDALAWLVSNEARYVTGQTLAIDGGFLIR
jgi:SDR family mycofactocin-dependent oxidoreductase